MTLSSRFRRFMHRLYIIVYHLDRLFVSTSSRSFLLSFTRLPASLIVKHEPQLLSDGPLVSLSSGLVVPCMFYLHSAGPVQCPRDCRCFWSIGFNSLLMKCQKCQHSQASGVQSRLLEPKLLTPPADEVPKFHTRGRSLEASRGLHAALSTFLGRSTM